ncbi:uncharacterized protein LOC142348778 [Convolutriloba macropyga]|uniref:uncharacterized protein LOC142348778 n=1 Tax=Convolutriloba macropyga TaxID=536237 RepID=UPI003F52848A
MTSHPEHFYDTECTAASPSTNQLSYNGDMDNGVMTIEENVMQMHLVLKFYFSPIEQQHVIYLLNLYRGNGNLNYLCLHLSSLVDTVSKRCFLKCLLPFVPKQHLDHYYKLIADLYNALNLDDIHDVDFDYLQQMDTSYRNRKNDHSLLELQKALGLSSDYSPAVRKNPDLVMQTLNPSLPTVNDKPVSHQSAQVMASSALSLATLAPVASVISANTQTLPANSTNADKVGVDEKDAALVSQPSFTNMCKDEEFDIEIKRRFNQAYGFKIKGGIESYEPVIIEEIGPGSQAEKSGLKKNDRIKSINSQSFEKISYKDATKLIRSNKKLKMTIVRKLPPSRSLAANSLIYEEPSFSDSQDKQTENSPRSSEMIWIDRKGERVLNYQDRLQNAERFKVLLVLPPSSGRLGFRIRGGSQFGIGIFISRVQPNTLASRHNLQFGDEILAVNNEDFSNVSHERAIELISMDRVVVMSLRRAGCIPDYARRANQSGAMLTGLSTVGEEQRPASAGQLQQRSYIKPLDSRLNLSLTNLADSDPSSDFKSLTSTDVPILSRNTSPATGSSCEMEAGRRRYRSTRDLNTMISPTMRSSVDRQDTLTNRLSKSSFALNTGVNSDEDGRRSPHENERPSFRAIQGKMDQRRKYQPRTGNTPSVRSNRMASGDTQYQSDDNPRIVTHSYDSGPSFHQPPQYHYSAVALNRAQSRSNSNLAPPVLVQSRRESSRVTATKGRQAINSRRDVYIKSLSGKETDDDDFDDDEMSSLVRKSKRIRVQKVADRLGIAIEGGADTQLQLPRISRIKVLLNTKTYLHFHRLLFDCSQTIRTGNTPSVRSNRMASGDTQYQSDDNPRIVTHSYDSGPSFHQPPQYHYSAVALNRAQSRSNSNLAPPVLVQSRRESSRVTATKGRQAINSRRDVYIKPLSGKETDDDDFDDDEMSSLVRKSKRIRVQKVADRLGIAIEGGADTQLQLPRISRIKPESCAWYNDELREGMRILEVNNKPLYGLTHAECGKKIAQSFRANYRDFIEFLVEVDAK